MLILGGWSTANLGRICKDFGGITSDSVDPRGVKWQSTWEGSTKTLQGLPLIVLILGINWQSTWEGSVKTLQGLPLIVLILGGQSTVNLGRIHKDFARITSDSVDPGRRGVNQQSTVEGSTKTLEGLPLTVLILGGGGSIDSELGRIHKDFARITSDSVDPGGGGLIDSQLGKDLQRLCKHYLW